VGVSTVTFGSKNEPTPMLRALREGEITSAALAETANAYDRAIGGKLQAYKERNAQRLVETARAADAAFARGQDCGPLQGIPVSVKDLFGVAGYPTHAGSSMRLPEEFEREGPVLAELRRQHCVITGKTHTVEFAFGGLGTNSNWGTPRNPWDAARHRVPGGSSAGAGVSLSCDALVALGTDTAGSVRIPASMTAQVGLKTTYGRLPTAGIVPLAPSMDSVGLMTRTAADMATIVGAFGPGFSDANADPVDLSTIRACVVDAFFWDDCSPGVAESVWTAIQELQSAGMQLRRLELPQLQPTYEIFAMGHLAAPELCEFLRSCLPDWLDRLTPQVAARMDAAIALPAYEYLRRRRALNGLAESAAARLAEVDVLLTPTVAITPPLVADLDRPDVYRQRNMHALRNTCPANLLGLCALSLPVGLDSQKMPVGLQLIARHGEDDRLLRVAAAIERRLGTSVQRFGRPPLRAD
jgi:aspartyl-tRNA(Asn)/glutamyl-tRNA(Gln) amidotransferase subunit A